MDAQIFLMCDPANEIEAQTHLKRTELSSSLTCYGLTNESLDGLELFERFLGYFQAASSLFNSDTASSAAGWSICLPSSASDA